MATDMKNRSIFEGFDPATKRQLLEDDHIAWTRVCTILMCIIAGGVLLGIFATIMCL